MKLSPALALIPVLVLSIPAAAGVVVETEIRVAGSESATGTEAFYVEGEMTRVDPSSTDGGEMSMIFRDQTMWFVDHGKKSCQKIDKATLSALSEQLGEMMKQLENMPPQQRKMMEQMMKGKMPGMRKPPEMRYEKGAATTVGDYACTTYTLYSDGEKVSESCVADESVADDLHEAMGAFQAMSRFTEDLRKMAEQLPFAGALENAFSGVAELDGFPIRTRRFDGEGNVVRESTLKSIERRDLDASMFEIPKGYKTKDLGKELRKGGR